MIARDLLTFAGFLEELSTADEEGDNQVLNIFSSLILLAVGLPVAYLYLLALAAVRGRSTRPGQSPRHRFAIAIPAHDEEAVVGRTLATLRQLDYPPHLFDIHVVADHCTDRTAHVARAAGAIVHERHENPRGSKGAALRWLFDRIFDESIHNPQSASLATNWTNSTNRYSGGGAVGDRPQRGSNSSNSWLSSAIRNSYDAVVIFDADTQVAPDFLRMMDARLAQGHGQETGHSRGDPVIQGQHRISNPEDGWFPALTWAMFIVDNRFQNLGRSNLGWSAKNMGDSICFRADVLRRLGWGEGLTEDYAFRQQLLLEGIKIRYEPAAVGYGEAPLTWQAARAQRARWLRGTHDASRRYAGPLLRAGLRCRDPALLDGALQAYLPSYSSLTLITLAAWLVHVAPTLFHHSPFSIHPQSTIRNPQSAIRNPQFMRLWSLMLGALLVYPLLGLALERAPFKAYLAMLSGPVFILWRTWLALTSRLGRHRVEWVRTPRKA